MEPARFRVASLTPAVRLQVDTTGPLLQTIASLTKAKQAVSLCRDERLQALRALHAEYTQLCADLGADAAPALAEVGERLTEERIREFRAAVREKEAELVRRPRARRWSLEPAVTSAAAAVAVARTPQDKREVAINKVIEEIQALWHELGLSPQDDLDQAIANSGEVSGFADARLAPARRSRARRSPQGLEKTLECVGRLSNRAKQLSAIKARRMPRSDAGAALLTPAFAALSGAVRPPGAGAVARGRHRVDVGAAGHARGAPHAGAAAAVALLPRRH